VETNRDEKPGLPRQGFNLENKINYQFWNKRERAINTNFLSGGIA
jgi:hypothetical protein